MVKIKIDPEAIYDLEAAATCFDTSQRYLKKEIKVGNLKAVERCGKVYMLGQWLLDCFALNNAKIEQGAIANA